MAFRTESTTLTNSTVTKIYTAAAGDLEIWVNPDDNGNDVFIGGPTVDSGKGLRLANTAVTFHTKVRPGDELYGYTVADPSTGINILVRSA